MSLILSDIQVKHIRKLVAGSDDIFLCSTSHKSKDPLRSRRKLQLSTHQLQFEKQKILQNRTKTGSVPLENSAPLLPSLAVLRSPRNVSWTKNIPLGSSPLRKAQVKSADPVIKREDGKTGNKGKRNKASEMRRGRIVYKKRGSGMLVGW